jgi:hypothetical protein
MTNEIAEKKDDGSGQFLEANRLKEEKCEQKKVLKS